MRRLRTFAVVLLTTATLLGVLASSAFAAYHDVYGWCNPQRNGGGVQWWAGSEETDYSSVTGIKANIKEVNSYVYGTADTTAWVMLSGPASLDLAQVGWEENNAGTRWVFVQYKSTSGTFPLCHWAGKSLGTNTNYKVEYEYVGNGNYKFFFYAAGSILLGAVSSFDPTKSSVMGEVKNLGSQTPGWSGYVETFYSAYRRSGMNWYGTSSYTLFYGDNAGVSNTTYQKYVYAGSGNSYIYDRAAC